MTKYKNTYILSWSACETLWTELSLLTFFSLERGRTRKKKGEKHTEREKKKM